MRPLGKTGITVSSLTLGTMNVGDMGNPDVEQCRRMIHTALDAGITSIDTADVHSYGQAERIVGEAIRGRRDDVVLTSRIGGPMDPAQPHTRRGGSRRWIHQAVHDSLRRLGTEHLDVLTLNRFDERTDLDETLGALSDLVRAGTVRTIGSCTWPAERLVEAQWTSDRRGHVKPLIEQPPYSLLVRHAEAAILPTAARYGIGVMSWSPLRGGWLAGKHRRGAVDMTTPRARFMPSAFDQSVPENQDKADRVEQLLALADEAGMLLAHLALTFPLHHPAVSTVCLGPRTPEHLENLLAAADTRLTDDILDRIDTIIAPGESIRPTYTGHANRDLLEPTRRR